MLDQPQQTNQDELNGMLDAAKQELINSKVLQYW